MTTNSLPGARSTFNEVPQVFESLAQVEDLHQDGTSEVCLEKQTPLDLGIIEQVFQGDDGSRLKMQFKNANVGGIQSVHLETQTRRAPKQPGIPNTVFGVMEYLLFLSIKRTHTKTNLFVQVQLVHPGHNHIVKTLTEGKVPFVCGQAIKVRFGTQNTFHKTRQKLLLQFQFFEQNSAQPIAICVNHNPLTLHARKPNKKKTESQSKRVLGKRQRDHRQGQPLKRFKTSKMDHFERELTSLMKVMNPLDKTVQKAGLESLFAILSK